MTQAVYNAKDYSGLQNVKFVMDHDDVEFRNSLRDDPNYVLVGDFVVVKKFRGKKAYCDPHAIIECNERRYEMFQDNSLKLVDPNA